MPLILFLKKHKLQGKLANVRNDRNHRELKAAYAEWTELQNTNFQQLGCVDTNRPAPLQVDDSIDEEWAELGLDTPPQEKNQTKYGRRGP